MSAAMKAALFLLLAACTNEVLTTGPEAVDSAAPDLADASDAAPVIEADPPDTYVYDPDRSHCVVKLEDGGSADLRCVVGTWFTHETSFDAGTPIGCNIGLHCPLGDVCKGWFGGDGFIGGQVYEGKCEP